MDNRTDTVIRYSDATRLISVREFVEYVAGIENTRPLTRERLP